MNCPRCSKSMKELANNKIAIDICSNGCGGIWLDWQELKRLDEAHELDADFLAQITTKNTKKVDDKIRVTCPDCKDIIMMRRFESVKRQIEVDECPKCGGIWLDGGELMTIQSQFKTEADRNKATELIVNELFDELKKAK